MGRYGTIESWLLKYVGTSTGIIELSKKEGKTINEILKECERIGLNPVEAFGFNPEIHRDVSTHWILGYVGSGKSIDTVATENKLSSSEVLAALLAVGKQQEDLNITGKILIGLDVGTSRLLVAKKTPYGAISMNSQRNAFLGLSGDWNTIRSLKRQKVNYVDVEGRLYLVGDNAYDYGNVFPHLELKRPMANGMLSIDPNALPIIKEIIGALIGQSKSEESVCAYSIPAPPVDVHKLVQYHTDVIEGIIKMYGYIPVAVNEGVAVANIGLEPYDLTGLALSFGGGLINACLMFKGLSALQISVSEAGDFIDGMSARDVGLAAIQMNAIKESDTIDISKVQTTREGQAIKSYYILCIRHALTEIANYFNKASDKPHFAEPIHIACAGGGVLIPGFSEVFEQEFNALDMPFKVAKDGVFIVDDPLTAVARGTLVEAELY